MLMKKKYFFSFWTLKKNPTIEKIPLVSSFCFCDINYPFLNEKTPKIGKYVAIEIV